MSSVLPISTIRTLLAYHNIKTNLLFALDKYSFDANISLLNIYLIKNALHFLSETSSRSLHTFRPNWVSHSLCPVLYCTDVLPLHPPRWTFLIRVTVLVSQPFRQQMPTVHDEICGQSRVGFQSYSCAEGIKRIWVTPFP